MSQQYDFVAIGDIVIDAFIQLSKDDSSVVQDIETGRKTLQMSFGGKLPYEDVTVVHAVGNSPNAAVSAHRLGLESALVTNVGHDRTQLKPISEKAQTAIRCEKIITIADRGYFNGEQVLACENTGILPIIPKTMTSNAAKQGYFTGVSVISCVLGHNG